MNVFTCAGRLTEDAILRFTADQTPVCNFTVASDVGFGEKKHALFIRCSLWGKRGESLSKHLTKGTPVTVSGEADLRTWDSNGKTGTDLTMRVNDVALQGSKPQSSQSGFRDKPAQKPAAHIPDEDIPF